MEIRFELTSQDVSEALREHIEKKYSIYATSYEFIRYPNDQEVNRGTDYVVVAKWDEANAPRS